MKLLDTTGRGSDVKWKKEDEYTAAESDEKDTDAIISYSTPPLDTPLINCQRANVAAHDEAMQKMEDTYYPSADGTPAPSTHFKDELERNGGINTHVVGAYNETS
jgi:hypothetical protein